MNVVFSDTAEYGCYLLDHACRPLLTDFMSKASTDIIGKGLNTKDLGVLITVNAAIRNHPVEVVGRRLRGYMTEMKKIV
jgi:ketol-acid reductoisomerase